MISIDARAFVAACESITANLPSAATRIAERAVDVGMVSLAKSSKWNDQTFTLRSAFREAFEATNDGALSRIDVDASVQGKRRTKRGDVPSKTPPNTYARFLDSGTSRIAKREFSADAKQEIAERVPFVVLEEWERVISSGS